MSILCGQMCYKSGPSGEHCTHRQHPGDPRPGPGECDSCATGHCQVISVSYVYNGEKNQKNHSHSYTNLNDHHRRTSAAKEPQPDLH